MKISNLTEMSSPASDISNAAGSQAPKFGRDPHVLENEKIEETTAGSIAPGAPTNMGVQRRGKGSMFQGIKTSKKFVNSPIKEAAIDPEQEKIDSLRRSRQEKERGNERELGKDPRPSGQYYVMINGTTYKRDGEAVMFSSSSEAHSAVERIRAFRKSKGWSSARYNVIQQKGMEEALDPKAISTLNQAKQSIAKNREADVAAWEQDFRKNFASKYGSQQPAPLAQRPLNIPATKPAPKPLEKHSVLKNRMGNLQAVIDKQKYLDYLTFKAEQKGLLNPRLEADIDTSLYVKVAEKDDYQALNKKLDKSIELMNSRLGVNKLAYKKPKPMREEGDDPYKSEPYDEFVSDTYGDDKPENEQGVTEESKGLWANIHAKRNRIKNGSGERMRKPGSKGAPTADALKKSATEGVAEGSTPNKGDEVYYRNRLVGWFVGYSNNDKVIVEPNEDEMGDEYETGNVYWDKDVVTIKPNQQGVAEGSLNESDKFTSWYDWKDQAKSSGYTITKKDDKIVALNKQGQVVGHWSDVGKFLSGKAPRPNFKQPVEQGVAEAEKQSKSREMDLDWHYKNIVNTKGLSDKAKKDTTDIYNKLKKNKEQGVAEGSEDKIAKHNAAVAKLPGGQAHRSNHPDLLKKAPKGYSFSVSHKLVPDKQGVAEGAPELLKKEMPLHRHAEKLLAQNGVSKDDPDYNHHLGNTIKHLRQFGNIDLINKQGVAEGIPDVDHMNGSRGIGLDWADTRDLLQKPFERYGNYKEWYRDVNRVNSELLDDNAEFSTMSGGKIISINGKDFAFWSNRNGNGSIDIGIAKKHSGQGVAEGIAETLPMDDAVKVLRQYGADHFKTTSNELHFYKQGRPFSVNLVMNPDATRSVNLSQLNSVTRGLKGQGVAEGKRTMSRTAKGIMKYGKKGMQDLADLGREGASEEEMDAARDEHDRYKKKVKENLDVMEAELSEEHLLASELKKRLDLFKKGKDNQLGSKPKDKEIMAKEGYATTERLPKEYIEKAIYRVLMKAYPEVINQYGAPIVSDAISSVAEMHADIEHIEAAEASIMLHQVISQLKRHLQMREEKQRLDPSCWKGYKKQGTKMKGGTKVNNCVPK